MQVRSRAYMSYSWPVTIRIESCPNRNTTTPSHDHCEPWLSLICKNNRWFFMVMMRNGRPGLWNARSETWIWHSSGIWLRLDSGPFDGQTIAIVVINNILNHVHSNVQNMKRWQNVKIGMKNYGFVLISILGGIGDEMIPLESHETTVYSNVSSFFIENVWLWKISSHLEQIIKHWYGAQIDYAVQSIMLALVAMRKSGQFAINTKNILWNNISSYIFYDCF